MAPSGFVALCLELLEGAGPVRARRLFGGHGIDCAGLFFALVARDRLYLKVDARTQADFESAGCQPFDYTARGRTVRTSVATGVELECAVAVTAGLRPGVPVIADAQRISRAGQLVRLSARGEG